MEQQFERAGLRVSSAQTIAQLRAVTISQFNVILVFLLVMAALLAVVGALGLAGAMSINVLERTREIGVMRAVGATGRAVRGIVIGEGALIGVLSWSIGLVLAVPISRLLSNVVGVGFLRTPLSYEFSVQGALIWLVAVLALSAAASLWPARNASRLSVREVLAYE
jgi:putative ABC transport system permease protein